MSKWLYKKGELQKGSLDAHVDSQEPPLAPWAHTGLRVGNAHAGIELPSDLHERVIIISTGSSVEVELGDQVMKLQGRTSVFEGPADVLYLPIETRATIKGDARVIIGEAPARTKKSIQLMRAGEVPVFIRGAGRETRQIHNFCMPDTMDADRIICVEGIVPAGNWSGVPAHKHDTYIPGVESHLEEIYYFESALSRGLAKPSSSEPFGYFRGYASDHRAFDVDTTIHSGDVVLIPHGYHGPVAAAPGYDLYFFNVMAGSDPVREWNVTDDPHHGWIRNTWENQAQDPRLPYGSESGR